MIPENTDTPQKADCPSAHCSPSSKLPLGKTFTLIGFGCAELVKRTKDEGLILWSICNYSGDSDEFTRGWSGCDPKQIYFLENDEMRDRHLEQTPPEKGNDL